MRGDSSGLILDCGSPNFAQAVSNAEAVFFYNCGLVNMVANTFGPIRRNTME